MVLVVIRWNVLKCNMIFGAGCYCCWCHHDDSTRVNSQIRMEQCVNCKCVRIIAGAWQQNCYMYYRVVKSAFLYFPMNKTEIRHAQKASQPRSWNCSLRKVAIATAIMKLFTAQNGYRNRDNEIVHCAKWLSQPRWRNCSLRKGSHNRDNEIVHCAKGN